MSFHRGKNTEYNGMSFSLAWFDHKIQIWKTYYRKFNLSFKHRRLHGQYSQNLYFDEKMNLKENDCKFMIYSVPTDTSYGKIFEGFENNNLDFILFKDIFILDKQQWAIYSPNLKYFKQSYVRLRGEKGENSLPTDNQLQIKIYDPYHGRTENKQLKDLRHHLTHHRDDDGILGITLPNFEIPIKNLPDWCIIEKEKGD